VARPSRKHDLLPCQSCADVLRCLWSSYEDKIQSSLQIVRLQRAADGGGDLEGCLAERKRSEGYAGGRDKTYCLESRQLHVGRLVASHRLAYSERCEYLGLANLRCRNVRNFALDFLAFHYWTVGEAILRLGVRHGVLV